MGSGRVESPRGDWPGRLIRVSRYRFMGPSPGHLPRSSGCPRAFPTGHGLVSTECRIATEPIRNLGARCMGIDRFIICSITRSAPCRATAEHGSSWSGANHGCSQCGNQTSPEPIRAANASTTPSCLRAFVLKKQTQITWGLANGRLPIGHGVLDDPRYSSPRSHEDTKGTGADR